MVFFVQNSFRHKHPFTIIARKIFGYHPLNTSFNEHLVILQLRRKLPWQNWQTWENWTGIRYAHIVCVYTYVNLSTCTLQFLKGPHCSILPAVTTVNKFTVVRKPSWHFICAYQSHILNFPLIDIANRMTPHPEFWNLYCNNALSFNKVNHSNQLIEKPALNAHAT